MAARMFHHAQYEVIAEVLAAEKAEYTKMLSPANFAATIAVNNIILALALRFSEENDNFNKVRFLTAADYYS